MKHPLYRSLTAPYPLNYCMASRSDSHKLNIIICTRPFQYKIDLYGSANTLQERSDARLKLTPNNGCDIKDSK